VGLQGGGGGGFANELERRGGGCGCVLLNESGGGVAIDKVGNLTVNWALPGGKNGGLPLLAGKYQDSLIFTFTVRP